jgi:release factor glutamine methyltransferase
MRRRPLLAAATARLEAAGVPSPAHDAEVLLAHVVGVERGQLVLLDEVGESELAEYERLLARRTAREPLQHLTGEAWFRHVRLEVGPGVFTPRPETELLAGWAVEQVQDDPIRIVDLCTGSGAIAKAVAHEAPGATVHAVELDETAHAYAARNLAGTGVDLRRGDAFTAFDDLLGTVDVVVCNPPYVPLEAWESVAPEARDHDPHLALFSGDDGLDAIRRLAVRAAELLRPGGSLGVEHADVQGESVPELLAATGRWVEVRDHRDLAGRARYTTARLAR